METLTEIGTRCKTDKATTHSFTEVYEKYFDSFKNEKIRLLEIGIFKGASLRMWNNYFSQGMIYGIDNCGIGMGITPESIKNLEKERLKTFIGDQSKREDLKKFLNECGSDFDIIIDDGLHFQEHQQISLGFLFPHIKSKGIYVIEDLCLPNRTKEGWGLKDFTNFSDNTTKILDDFKNTGKIVSPYMTDKETAYLNQHIKDVKIFKIDDERDMIAFIRKG